MTRLFSTRSASGKLIFALASLVLSPSAAIAESASDHAWQASWIGPSIPDPLPLDGSNWIWSNEPGIDPTVNAAGGSRLFRHEFQLVGTQRIVSATAVFTADNRYKLVVNGQEIGAGEDWRSAKTFDISTALRLGGNRIVVQADNDGNANPAGLIGKIRIERQGLGAQDIVTDAQWSCAGLVRSRVENSSGFGKKADPAWAPVQVLGGNGIGPWGPISASSAGVANIWTCYRKSVSLTTIPTTAPTRIAVDSKYWLWVNGTLVVREGGLKRGPNPQDTYFDQVDLAPYLVQGENQIAVLAWYFGKPGFAHNSSGKAGFLFEMEAGTTRVLSDSTWKIVRHPAFGASPNEPNFRLAESSVRFDARQDPVGWTTASFNDAAWQSPKNFGAPPSAPWNRLWERTIPQWKDYGLKNYENAEQIPQVATGSSITAKLPYNAQVAPWLQISATAGQVIRIGTDNTANEIIAEYITREGEQEFETPAWMNGHAVVYQIPAGVEILGLKYRESGYNTAFTGSFSCDQPFFNTLWTKSLRTLYVTMRDNFMDCPDRERAAWWGDIVNELGEVFYSLSPSSHPLIRKSMYNLVNWQRSDKTLFSPIPAGNWSMELPQQMLASVGKYGFWNYYLNTADAATIQDMYPHVKDYLSVWQTDANGLIAHRGGQWDWADWGENVDARVMDHAWFCLALDGAANMAELSGNPAEAAAYRKQRSSIAAAVNQHFWNGSAYRDPGYGGTTDDRANGLAVVAGFASPDQFPAIKTLLANTRNASPYMEKYVLESLFLMGDPTAALARMQLRYQEMVDSPLTTLWELFGPGGTLNHAWSGGPLTLLSEYVAGVSPTSPGYAKYQVKPQMGSLQQVSATVPSVKGLITVAVTRSTGSFSLNLTSPAATTATVHLPVSGSVLVNGQPPASVSGLTYLGRLDDHEVFEVIPGQWSFSATSGE